MNRQKVSKHYKRNAAYLRVAGRLRRSLSLIRNLSANDKALAVSECNVSRKSRLFVFYQLYWLTGR